MTVRAGVVGSPARHSLSPLIHSAWLKAAGIDGVYRLYDIAADGFAGFLQGALDDGLRGVNVTLPFKEQALMAADEASEAAQLAGAAMRHASSLCMSRRLCSHSGTRRLRHRPR